jgi:hypothetical protein
MHVLYMQDQQHPVVYPLSHSCCDVLCHAAGAAGASFSPCQNFFVPQINNGNGVNADCEKPEGGVSFACLAGKLG